MNSIFTFDNFRFASYLRIAFISYEYGFVAVVWPSPVSESCQNFVYVLSRLRLGPGVLWCTISAKNQSWNSTSNLWHEHRTLPCNIDILRTQLRTFACKVGQHESTFNLKDQTWILRRLYRLCNFEFTLKKMPCNTQHPIWFIKDVQNICPFRQQIRVNVFAD